MRSTLLTILSFGAVLGVHAQSVFPTNGDNAGVGVTAPDSRLHINVTTDSKPNGVVAPAASVLKMSRFGTPYYSYNEAAEFRIAHGGPSVWGSRLELFVNGPSNTNNIPDKQVMVWNYDGNVGIGLSEPKAKIDINGSALLGGQQLNLDAAGHNINYLANTGKLLIGWNRLGGRGETDLISNQGAGDAGGFAFFNHNNSAAETLLMRIHEMVTSGSALRPRLKNCQLMAPSVRKE